MFSVLGRSAQVAQSRIIQKGEKNVRRTQKKQKKAISKIEVREYHSSAKLQRNMLDTSKYSKLDEVYVYAEHVQLDVAWESWDNLVNDANYDEVHVDPVEQSRTDIVTFAKQSQLFDEKELKTVEATISQAKGDGLLELKKLKAQSPSLEYKLSKVKNMLDEKNSFSTKEERQGLEEDKKRSFDLDGCSWIASVRDPEDPAQAMCAINFWHYFTKKYEAPSKRLLNLFLTDIIPTYFKGDKDFQPWPGIHMRPSTRPVYLEDRERAHTLIENFEKKLKAKFGAKIKPSCNFTCDKAACPCYGGTGKEWADFLVKRQELLPGWSHLSELDYKKIQTLPKDVLANYNSAFKAYEEAKREHLTDIPEFLPDSVVEALEDARAQIEEALDEKYPQEREQFELLLESFYRGKITMEQARIARTAILKGDAKKAQPILDMCGPVKFRGIDYPDTLPDPPPAPVGDKPRPIVSPYKGSLEKYDPNERTSLF